jgi:hypothetical protein
MDNPLNPPFLRWCRFLTFRSGVRTPGSVSYKRAAYVPFRRLVATAVSIMLASVSNGSPIVSTVATTGRHSRFRVVVVTVDRIVMAVGCGHVRMLGQGYRLTIPFKIP